MTAAADEFTGFALVPSAHLRRTAFLLCPVAVMAKLLVSLRRITKRQQVSP